jgi:hypothetical protein
MTSRLLVDKIEGKTATNTVQMPSGSVIQVQRASIGGNIQTTSSTPVATGLECAITPKFSTSLIQVELVGGRSYVLANQQLDITLYKDGSKANSVGTGRWESKYSNSYDHHHGGYSACFFENAENTNSRTFQVYFDVGSGTGHFNNSPSGNNEFLVHLIITEIAQ